MKLKVELLIAQIIMDTKSGESYISTKVFRETIYLRTHNKIEVRHTIDEQIEIYFNGDNKMIQATLNDVLYFIPVNEITKLTPVFKRILVDYEITGGDLCGAYGKIDIGNQVKLFQYWNREDSERYSKDLQSYLR